jgi:hypothetical protein
MQMCSGHGLDAALLECLTPQCRDVESIQICPSSHIDRLVESRGCSDHRAMSMVVCVVKVVAVARSVSTSLWTVRGYMQQSI